MPRVNPAYPSQYTEPAPVGPVAQCDFSGIIPTSFPASGGYDSGIFYADGFKSITAGVKMNQAGSITISRYLDANGVLPAAAPATQAVTANNAAVLTVADNVPFLYVRIQITNTAGSPATVAAAAALLNAN